MKKIGFDIDEAEVLTPSRVPRSLAAPADGGHPDTLPLPDLHELIRCQALGAKAQSPVSLAHISPTQLQRTEPSIARSPLLLLSESAIGDFADVPTNDPNAVVVGLAPDRLDYSSLNTAFRLLSKGSAREGHTVAPLIATHRALYFRDADHGLSLGPGLSAS